jgi:hypothetical protein
MDMRIIAVAVATVLAAGVGLTYCTPHRPTPAPTALAPKQGAAVASPTPSPDATPTPGPVAVVRASQDVHVVIRRPARPASSLGASTDPTLVGPTPDQDEVIDITMHQDAGASVPIVVITPTPVPVTPEQRHETVPLTIPTVDPHGINHSRLGVLLGYVPAGMALDVQLLRGQPLKPLVTWQLVPEGAGDIEMSVDAVLNHRALGLGAAVGGPYFVQVGGDVNLDNGAGWYAGAGLRF